MVKGEDSQLSGCGFESRRRIPDGVSKASYYIEKGNKSSQMGHTKKIFKKSFPIPNENKLPTYSSKSFQITGKY